MRRALGSNSASVQLIDFKQDFNNFDFNAFRVVLCLAHCFQLKPLRKWAKDIDGRPRFVKRSIGDCGEVKIAAIDPDFV